MFLSGKVISKVFNKNMELAQQLMFLQNKGC